LEEIHGDGHEKLGAQALEMGGVGLPIYGLKDKYSSFILLLRVVPNDRLPATIGHFYLDFITAFNSKPFICFCKHYLTYILSVF